MSSTVALRRIFNKTTFALRDVDFWKMGVKGYGTLKYESSLAFGLLLLTGCSSAEFRHVDGGQQADAALGGDEGAPRQDAGGSPESAGDGAGGHAGESFDASAGQGGVTGAAGGHGAFSQDGSVGGAGGRRSLDAGDDRGEADLQMSRDSAQEEKIDTDGLGDYPAAPDDRPTDAPFGSDSIDSASVDRATSAPTFRLVRVGDGLGLSSAAAPAFIEERALDGTLLGAVPLPTSSSGGAYALTLSGTATSEGALTLSGDGRYLVLGGYAAPVGTAAVATSSAPQVPRVIGRVDASGNVDTTTSTSSAFDGNNVRSAASRDGQDFWLSGAGGTTGGIWYLTLGGGLSVHVLMTPNNVRWLSWRQDGRLFASTGVAPVSSVFAVGQGAPTSNGQAEQDLPGLPTKPTTFGFAFVDTDATVSGFETLYLANDQAPPSGGIQKWIFDGATWTQKATFNLSTAPVGFRGVATIDSPSGVLVLGTTAEASPNRVVVFMDDGSVSPAGTPIATARKGTIFRGLSPSPHF